MSDKEELDCTKYETCLGNFEYRDNPKKILERLKCGNIRFMTHTAEADATKCPTGNMIHPNQSDARRKQTENEQTPFAIILSCADSRVPPEVIFDTGIGDLFVVRVAGNIANTSSIASIEFAISSLGCQFILVLGHEDCGAVKTAIEINGGKAPSKNLDHLLKHITPAVNACKCDEHAKKDISLKTVEKVYNGEEKVCSHKKVKKVTIENAHHTTSELLHHSEILRKAFLSEKLAIHTGYYKMASGKVVFDPSSKC